jgi:hypothetical protein
MILIVTPNLRTDECTALGLAVGEEVVVADSLRQAGTLLRADSYLLVVLINSCWKPNRKRPRL